MKVVMTLLVRNEEDIIREQILFHFNMGVDHVIVTDNGSEDNTVGILRDFEEQRKITLLFEHDDDYAQSDWVTRMAQLARSKYKADWVLNSDADEFWWPSSGNLKDVLSLIPDNVDALKIKRYNFVPSSENMCNALQTMTIKDNCSTNHLGIPLPSKVCHRGIDDIVVEQGNHDVSGNDKLTIPDSDEIIIFHFPMRSYFQFQKKISLGGAAYERNTKLPEYIGDGWRKLYKVYLQGGLKEFYLSQIPDEGQIATRLASGLYETDYRLRDFLIEKNII